MSASATNPFTAIRSQLRKQAEARQVIASRVAASYAPIPVTSAEAITTSDHSVAALSVSAARAEAGRFYLTRKRRESQRAAHGAAHAAEQSYQSSEWYAWNGAIAAEYRLTAHGRDLVRFIRNSDKREELAAAGQALPENPVAVEHQLPTSSRLPKGLIDGRETRVHRRGATGIRGLRVKPGERVSQADHRIPSWLLKRLDTVGVATHPDADEADYASLLLYLRQHPMQASVRVYADAADTYGRIVSIEAFMPSREEAETREAKSPRASAPITASAPMPDVLRYAGIVGYVGNVD